MLMIFSIFLISCGKKQENLQDEEVQKKILL